jgi:NADPH-dependent 2,4-dienoyl-CoA reductase/sulfur reductase-like enzyme
MVGGTREIGYDRLIVATGATPRRPRNLPDINGVVVLRALGDALALRAAATAGARVLVVGGGLIGSELASSLSTLGATATIVEAAPVPLVRAFGTTVATRLSQLHERHGTELLRGVEVVEVEVVVDPDGAARVSAARLSNGRRLDVDLVVAGIGATPATRWLAGSGLALNPRDGAVVCDGYLRSSDPAVYAAGDVAEWPGGPAGTRTRLENWSNAGEQGVVAGRNAVTGHAPTAYETVPYFWSDWYGHRIQFVGSPLGDDVRFYRTAGPRYGFVALYREGGRLAGAAAVNGQKMMMKYRRLIRDGASYEEGVALFAGELAEDPGGSGDLALARPGGATAPAALNEQPGLLRGEDGT